MNTDIVKVAGLPIKQTFGEKELTFTPLRGIHLAELRDWAIKSCIADYMELIAELPLAKRIEARNAYRKSEELASDVEEKLTSEEAGTYVIWLCARAYQPDITVAEMRRLLYLISDTEITDLTRAIYQAEDTEDSILPNPEGSQELPVEEVTKAKKQSS